MKKMSIITYKDPLERLRARRRVYPKRHRLDGYNECYRLPEWRDGHTIRSAELKLIAQVAYKLGGYEF